MACCGLQSLFYQPVQAYDPYLATDKYLLLLPDYFKFIGKNKSVRALLFVFL